MVLSTRAPAPWFERPDERFHQLVELAPDGILIHDGEHVVAANAAAHRLAGATQRGELLGRDIDSLLDGPFLKGVESQLVGSIGVGAEVPPVREQLHRLDGRDLDVEVRALAFLDGGRPAAHLVIRDITERLAVEAATRENSTRLQQAQKMEAVGALSGGIAHEVNNMMQVILGYGTELLDRHPTDEQGRPELEEILRAAGRAAAVTQQLLAFSRHAVHRPELLDLGTTVRSMEGILRRLVGDHRALVLALEPTPPVLMDPGQLEQVLVNLVLNARDATDAGGTIRVTVAPAEVHGVVLAADGARIPEGPYGTVRVRDDGAGMDKQTQAHAFEPFFTTKAIGRGTGLGLAAVHGILSQNDGFIALDSAPGRGTSFTIHLPVASAQATAELEPRSADAFLQRRRGDRTPPANGELIVVVDDEPVVRSIAARILRYGGYSVVEAADAATALALIEGGTRPQLILSDVLMPHMNGAEFARDLKRRCPDVPVVFMSGYSGTQLRLDGTLGETDRLVEKPFSTETLLREVARALEATAPQRAR